MTNYYILLIISSKIGYRVLEEAKYGITFFWA